MSESQRRASDLALVENACLRSIYDRDGAKACEDAARHLLTATATIFAMVSGPEQLKKLFASIEASQSPKVLS